MNSLSFRAPWLLTAARVFASAGAPLYAVGGAVRNALMGLPASDIDVCGPARPEQVMRFCEGTPVCARLRAAHFGTVELHVADGDGRHMAEYTTFRVDSYRCGHQPDAVRFADTPEADALRRDFSVNALYRPLPADPDAPVAVIDPTGGLEHMRCGILHTVTDDPDQVLKDDGLRILRAARFQAELGFTPTARLLASAERYAALLNDIAMERLRDELTRLLLADGKYPMLTRTVPPVAAGLKTAGRVGAWRALFGALAYDETAVKAIDSYCAPKDLPPVSGRLALLFTRAEPDALARQMGRLRYSTAETIAAAAALTAEKRISTGRLTRMDAVRLGETSVAHAAAALGALRRAGEPCDAALSRAQNLLDELRSGNVPLSLKALAVRGGDLLPLCRAFNVSVTRIGRTLDALWQATVEKRVPNERDSLMAEARRLFSETNLL